MLDAIPLPSDPYAIIVSVIGGIGAIILGMRTVVSRWKKFGNEDKKTETETDIIASLHKEFQRISKELDSARDRQTELNEKFHEQSLKVNRMEFLVLRMYNLLVHNNIGVPQDLRESIEDMLGSQDK